MRVHTLTHTCIPTHRGEWDCFCSIVITDKWLLCVPKLSSMDQLISWPGRPRPPVCYYKQPGSCDRGERLLEKLIETALYVLCWWTVGWLFGEADWYSALLCPLQPQTGHYKQWACQSQQTWPACSEPDRSFEARGFPLSWRWCVSMGLVVHPQTWLKSATWLV